MKNLRRLLTILFLSVLMHLNYSCNTSKQAFVAESDREWQLDKLPEGQLEHTLFLIGDAGDGELRNAAPTLKMLKSQLIESDENSSVVFLGNNIPRVRKLSDKTMSKVIPALRSQLSIIKDFKGKSYFLSGENEWGRGAANGLQIRLWEEAFIESALENEEVFLPGEGCGEPFKVKVSKDLVFIFIDSQWWLANWNRTDNINENCEIKDRFAFLQDFEGLLKKYDNDQIVVMMHHPLFSNGPHGGSYPLRNHLVPFPGIGTLITFFRHIGASQQDIAHKNYTLLRQEILAILAKKPVNENVIFVGAHDHSLQYHQPETGLHQHHFIVSGSASGEGYARGGKKALYAYTKPGFSKLYFYKDGQVWLEFWTTQGSENRAELSFRKKIVTSRPVAKEKSEKVIYPPMPDSITVSASDIYDVSGIRKVGFGDRYRKAWEAPITVPIFNLEEEFSHLEIVKLGGGMSSKSLRFEAENGKQYVLRSVNKSVRKGLPEIIRQTVAEDIIQDLKSGSHPYGAFAVPYLAEAVGIYHTHPRLYFLPRQERLGELNDILAGELYLFEERPDDDWSDEPDFGNSEKIISYSDLLKNLKKHPKHQIDGKFALRTRLFDQLIHDYDRHDDQFRWASFEQEDGDILYRPIPRDRDQAFFDLRGVVPWFLSRRWLAIQQRGFHEKINDVPGEAFPGKNFDRTYLTELDHDDWMEVVLDMQSKLTDDVIENAFKDWPDNIYELNGPHIIEVLKGRRDNMHNHAEELYFFWAKYVDVTGSDKREDFEITRLLNGDVEVKVFHVNKEREKRRKSYERYFKASETKEIRLYGLGEDDFFHITGNFENKIRIRIIGGEGNDEVLDESKSKGRKKSTVLYDVPDGIEFNKSEELKDKTSRELKVNEYDRFEYYYNKYFPLVTFGRTIDDGFFLGGGLQLTYYRFRKKPYGIKHRFFGRLSTQTDAVNLSYSSDFTEAIGEFDFNPSVSFDRPQVFQFFGLGNETRDTAEDRSFNRVRLETFQVQTLLKKRWYNDRNFTRFGPYFERVEVENGRGRITDADIFRKGELGSKIFTGLILEHEFNSLDQQIVPRSGVKIQLSSRYFYNISDNLSYVQLGGSISTFATIEIPFELTLGTRVGMGTFTNDDFLFYQANNLGGNNYLRGFRNNRFTGQSIFYHNSDIRTKLFYSKNKVVPFEMGISLGFDYGRTWSEAKDGEIMHTSLSPGFWLTPYKFTVINAFYSFTEDNEQDAFTFRLGFFF